MSDLTGTPERSFEMSAKTNKSWQLRVPSSAPTEEAVITAAANADPDNPLATDEELATFRRARDVHPELVREYRRTRGKSNGR